MIDGTENENELAAQIDKLDASLEAVHETLKVEGQKRDKRIRTNRIAIGLAIVIALVGIAVGIRGINAMDESNAERDASRVGSCLQYNKQQVAQIAAEIVQSHDFVNALTAASNDPDIRTKVDLYDGKHDALIQKSHPLRDCSSDGIDRYLQNKDLK